MRPSELFLFSLKSHRWGILGISAVVFVFMWVIGLGYAHEAASSPGGATSLGAAVEASARAMRIARWPAERLDTVGGYLTYHNLILLPLLVGIYAVVQGTRAIRGVEEDGVLAEWIVGAGTRLAVLRDRVFAFGVALVAVAAALALGGALAVRAVQEPLDGDALVVGIVATLAVAWLYALGLLVSQLVRGAGRAAGVASMVMLALYVVSNTWEDLGALGALRFVSPFYLRQRSDVLIPGHAFDAGATLALAAVTALMVAAAAAAFERRDLGAALWEPRGRERTGPAPRVRPVGMLAAALGEQRLALVGWAAVPAVLMGMYASLGPSVLELWETSEFMRALLLRWGEGGFVDRYIAFSLSILPPVVGAFAAVQAGRWAADGASGKLEMLLASPVPRRRVALDRLAVVAVGALVPIAGGLGGFAVGAVSAGLGFDVAGLARTALDLELFALAVGGAGALLVLFIRSAVPGLLGGLLALSYLLTIIALLLDWPDWVARASVFEAYGEPYIGVPAAGGLLLLTAIAVIGTAAAAEVMERRSRV